MDLLIFDCDGVLVDSEVIALGVVERELTARLPGCQVAPLLQNTAGMTTDAIVAMVARRCGRPLPPDTLPEIHLAVDRALDKELQPIAGAEAVLRQVTLPIALASNSDRERVRRSLLRAGLTDFFGERVFSVDMVTAPKPAPDLYLMAARRLGVRPERCLVVEDSEPGVTAARRAGMAVIGFTGASHVAKDQPQRLQQAGAAVVIQRLEALPELVAGWSEHGATG